MKDLETNLIQLGENKFLIHPRLQPGDLCLLVNLNRFNGFQIISRPTIPVLLKTVETVNIYGAPPDPQAEAWGE